MSPDPQFPPLDGAGRPKCYVKNMSGVFDEMYHYTGDIQRLRVVAGEVRLSAYSGERGWYVSTSKLSNPLDAKEALQLPSTTNSRYRFRFSTPQADSNLKLPYGDQYAGKHFEPLTRDFPDLGRGGSRQLLLENKEVTISEVFDLEQGRALTNQEVMQLLGQ